MATGLSHRVLAAALERLQKDRETELKHQQDADRRKLDEEEARNLKNQDELALKKRDLEVKARKEAEEVEKLRAETAHEMNEADEEQKLFDVQRRMQEFAGSDDDSLRRRLIGEGFAEELVSDSLKRRTLDQTLERPGSMPASFSHWQSGGQRAWDEEKTRLESVAKEFSPLYQQGSRDGADPFKEDPLRQLYRSGANGEPDQNQMYNSPNPSAQYHRADGKEENDDIRWGRFSDSVRKQMGLDNDQYR